MKKFKYKGNFFSKIIMGVRKKQKGYALGSENNNEKAPLSIDFRGGGEVEMKVILKQDIANLGLAGEVKEVKEGYARNYLLPRNLAEELTAGRLQEARKQAEKRARKQERDRVAAESLEKKLRGIQLTLHARGGEKGKLFGSVTAADIARGLEEKGISVDKRKIDIDQPIKTLGTHRIVIKLHPQVAPALDIVVEEEKGE